jgi:hypothetical protein
MESYDWQTLIVVSCVLSAVIYFLYRWFQAFFGKKSTCEQNTCGCKPKIKKASSREA